MAFGCYHNLFADNSKYLYIYACEHVKSRKSVWLSADKRTVKRVRDLGLCAYHVYSLQGIWYALRAKYWFVNSYSSDILFCLAGNATLVNLWHGVPQKAIEFLITEGELRKRYVEKRFWDVFYHPASFRCPDYISSTTAFFDDIFSRAFRITKDRCLHVGCPRNEILLYPRGEVLSFVAKYETKETLEFIKKLQQYKGVYVYMPTWRDSQADIFANGFDLERLNQTLLDRGGVMLMKPHPNTKIDTEKEYSNLLFINNTLDIYPILPFTDVLITDYSSVMYDYMLMEDKGIILFHYDYEEYVGERQFLFPLDENIVGTKVYSFDKLLDCISGRNYSMDAAKRDELINKFWGDTMRMNVCENILKQLNLFE